MWRRLNITVACAAAMLVPELPLAADAQPVEVWVVLSEPALASLPRDAKEERAALRERIFMQQNNVIAQLVALGATQSGRIQHSENAVAIRLPAAAIESVKKIDGVIDVRPVSHRNRIDVVSIFTVDGSVTWRAVSDA